MSWTTLLEKNKLCIYMKKKLCNRGRLKMEGRLSRFSPSGSVGQPSVRGPPQFDRLAISRLSDYKCGPVNRVGPTLAEMGNSSRDGHADMLEFYY